MKQNPLLKVSIARPPCEPRSTVIEQSRRSVMGSARAMKFGEVEATARSPPPGQP